MADSSEKTALVEDDHEDMSSGEEEGDGDKAVALNAGKVTQMGSLFKVYLLGVFSERACSISK